MTSNKRQKLSIALSLEPTSTSTSTFTSQNGHNSIEHPVRATLSERLKNLWDQRGDFSDFNADKLRLKLKSQQQDHDDGQEGVAEDSGSGDKKKLSLDKTEFDFQIPENEESESNGKGKGKGKEKEQQTSEESTDKQDPNSSSNDPSSRDTITSNQMFNLRIEMMNHLSQAHYDLFYLSSLLTYVSNFTKPVLSQPQSNTHANNLSLPSRAASPSTSSVGRRNNQARTTGTGGGSGSVNDQSQHFQSQTPAEELGLDPHSIGLSLVMNEVKARRDQKQEEDDDDDDDDEEEEFLEPLDIRNLSIKERIRENSLLISEKRSSLVNSIDILRNGARSINPLAFVDEDQNQEEEVKASNDSRNSEMERFEILKKLKSNGWGINPSKAQLPKNVFGMSLEVGGQAVNNEDGGGLNGARDCLIGWGVPEALSHFRTQSFAYIGSSSSKEPDSTPSSELIFPRRQYRRLRVVFVVNRLEIIDGEEILIEERFGSFIPDVDDQNHVEPKEFVKESNQDIEMTDPSSSNVDQEKSEEKQEKVDLDTELKKAQKEMMDEELFSELVGQYRRIERKFGLDDDFFGIDDKLIPSSNQRKNLEGGGDSFKPKTKLSMNHLSISLNSKVELRFEMVPTAASDDSKKKKKNLDEITDIKKERYHFSHVASLVRGCFEMEIIRRYRSRAGIDSTTTTSPSGIGHKTNNWKGGKKTLEDERKSQEGHSLQCLIMVVRYFTFVNQLESLLNRIVSDQNSTSKVQSQSKIELSWNPISNITDLGKWIEQLMLGQTGNESQSGLIGIVESLGGNASLWKRNKPLATLTFSSSLNLSLQLPQPFRPGLSAEDQDQEAKENPGSRQKTQVPRDGKGRTINGLNLKQLELFLKNALMES